MADMLPIAWNVVRQSAIEASSEGHVVSAAWSRLSLKGVGIIKLTLKYRGHNTKGHCADAEFIFI